MTKVSEIYSYIDSIAPFCTQASWDNSGLLIGDMQAEAEKALVCLDLTKEAAQYAADHNCNGCCNRADAHALSAYESG